VTRLKGKQAIVTGAGSGIGRGTAMRFASEGARVLVVGRSQGNIEETVALIRAAGGEADSFLADVGTEEGASSAVARSLELYGSLDIFYANAGCTDKNAAMTDQTIEQWEEVFRGNVITSLLAVKHASPPMVARGQGGSIILMSSSGSLRANGGTLAYSACKAAVNSLTQGAANALSGTDVRVNAILSGLVETKMTRATFDQARAKGVEGKIGHITPLKRAGRIEEIAAVAAFLASDDSSFIDGQLIAADGGFSSTHPYARVAL
jgi:NAD(P)-dependent dehydrogenase (short-subunit alcohol dehydrogenase family)